MATGYQRTVPKAYEILSKNAHWAAAQFHLAELHIFYEEIETDKERTKSLLHQAFEQGYEKALLLLQTLSPIVSSPLLKPRSVSTSCLMPASDSSWVGMDMNLYRAANAKDVYAQYNLYKLYAKKDGPFADDDIAIRECQLRMLRGEPIAEILFAKMYEDDFGKIKDRTGSLFPHYQQSFPIYRKFAMRKYAWAQYALGVSYIANRVRINYKNGIFWLAKAVAQGYAPAEFYLGVLHVNGMGVPRNELEATKLFRLAAQKGDPLSQIAMGFRCEKGYGGVIQDDGAAIQWYLSAAKQEKFAQGRLNVMYADGK